MKEERCRNERLHEYLDGELEPAEATAVAAHLHGCIACRAELAALVDLRDRARRLPTEIRPARELWPEIAARIEAGSAVEVARGALAGGATGAARPDADGGRGESQPAIDLPRRRALPDPSWRWLAAAAVLLVAVSSATTAYLFRDGPGTQTGVVATELPAGDHLIGLAAFEPAEEDYRHTVAMLEAELDARRGELLPETVTAVEANLAIIDRAIFEARQALAADPASADLPLLLSGVYRRKVELLQQAVTLSARS